MNFNRAIRPVIGSYFAVAFVLTVGCSSTPKSETPAATPAKADMKDTRPAPPMDKPAKAEKNSAPATADSFSCESGSDKRSVEIKPSGQGCEVMYTKNDKTESVARSRADAAYCAKTVAKIRDHLEKAGFTCH